MDWESSDSQVLLNPRMRAEEREKLHGLLPVQGIFSSHVWLLTSGSTAAPDEYKCVALSKGAIIASAQAVNQHLRSDSSDIWLNPLPHFHVGGLGIMARGHLSGAKVVDFQGRWDAALFYQSVINHQVTLTAMVPTQLHDLVLNKLPAPAHLRAVVIGGGRLDQTLYLHARGLGWRVLPSYGLTEAASQVATANLDEDNPFLEILGHIQVRINGNGYIALKGPSLLTCYALIKQKGIELVDPKVEGWLHTEDRGSLSHTKLAVVGRSADFIKIGGESVNLLRLESLLAELKASAESSQPVALLGLPDERLGHAIHLAVEGELAEETKKALDHYQQQVLPFERIRQIHTVKEFPRSELDKILKAQLKQLVMQMALLHN